METRRTTTRQRLERGRATDNGVRFEGTQTHRAAPSRVGDAMAELRRAVTDDETEAAARLCIRAVAASHEA